MENKDYLTKIDGAERRFYTFPVEIREDSESKSIEGIAAVVNRDADLGWFVERIAPGAFDDVLKDDVRALFNHDPNFILARSVDGKGTLDLFINDNGDLGYRYSTPDRSYARDLEDAIKSGDVSQSSFGFSVAEDSWEYSEDRSKPDVRTILKLKRLYDVSPVTYPAYQDTSVAKRSMESHKPEINRINIYRKRNLLNEKLLKR